MAIFSSSKKKKEASSGGAASPPLGSSARSEPGSPPVVRSQSGSGSGIRYDGAPSSGIPISQSSTLLQQSAPGSLQGPGSNLQQTQLSSSLPPSSSSGAKSPPPTNNSGAPPNHTVHYPWSTRALQYGPQSSFNPKWTPSQPTLSQQFIEKPYASSDAFPRYGHSVNPTASLPNGDLYIFGGLVNSNVRNDLYVISSGAGGSAAPGSLGIRSVETQGEIPGPRVGHASVGVGNVLIVWGGDTKSKQDERQDDSLYLLNLTTGDWTRVKTSGPAPEGRYGHAAAMVGSRFFIFGGQKDDGGFMNDLVWFDLQKLKAGAPRWTFIDYPAKAVVPPMRTGHTAVTHGDCIYIFGGTDGQYHYNDTWCYDTNAQIWTELSCIGYIPVPREGHAATLVDDVMYVFGGRGVDGKDLEDLAAFKISNQRWFMFQNMGPAPSGRSGHAMATYQNKVYVLGGESYTSLRADNPAFVHVLDTSKIKYPQDNSRSAASRKSSVPNGLNGTTSPPMTSPTSNLPPALANQGSNIPALQVHSPNGATSPHFNDRDNERSVSPTNRSVNPNNPAPSFGQVLEPSSPPPGTRGKPIVIPQTQGQQQQGFSQAAPQSKIAKRITGGATSPPPQRPPRPGDEAFGSSSSMSNGNDGVPSTSTSRRTTLVETGDARDRAMSPTGSMGRGPRSEVTSPTMSVTPRAGGGAPTISTRTSPVAPQGDWSQQAQQQHESTSTSAGQGLVGQSASSSSPPQDAFYYGSKPPTTTAATNGRAMSPSPDRDGARNDQEVAQLKAREKWYKAALGMAVKKGFVAPASDGEDGGAGVETSEADGKVVQMLIELKQELAKAKSALAEQAQSVDERVSAATRARSAALQEATYYRAKLSAVESGSLSEASKLSSERSRNLEHKLTEALAAKSVLEHQVEKLQGEVDHHSEMRTAVEERHSAAVNRADAAESSYSRSLADYAELQQRARGHESTVQDHLAELASLRSKHDILAAENGGFRSQVDEKDTALQHHSTIVEQTQVALAAAQARNEETHSAFERATQQAEEHRLRAEELQTQLDAKHSEAEAATTRAAEVEKVLASTRAEHEATKLLATGGLATFLEHQRSNGGGSSSRSIAPEEHAEKLRALENEASSVRQLHLDAKTRADSSLAELDAARQREASLSSQVAQLGSELSALRSEHAQTLDSLSQHRSTALDRDGEFREHSRAKEAAEVKVGLLRNLMAEHGLPTASDEELAARYPPMSGNETPEQLHRRVQELESRLETKTRAHGELEGQHENLRREVGELEGRHRAKEEEVEKLKVGGGEGDERTRKVEEELEGLKGRHATLEQTHTRAIAYVKGTEKMLRRMKEELTRYKERNEELETTLSSHAGTPSLRSELDTLRSQLSDLHTSSTRSAQENTTLQSRLASLTAEHAAHRSSTDEKVQELERELEMLDGELEKSRADLGESLSANQDLQIALKKATGGAGGSSGSGDVKRLEAELQAAHSKADWYKRENASLEKRCEIAEQKIHILLDHMEGAGDMSPTGNHNFEQHQRGGSDAGSDYSQGETGAHR